MVTVHMFLVFTMMEELEVVGQWVTVIIYHFKTEMMHCFIVMLLQFVI